MYFSWFYVLTTVSLQIKIVWTPWANTQLETQRHNAVQEPDLLLAGQSGGVMWTVPLEVGGGGGYEREVTKSPPL
jgi:hypothetical protein